MTPEPEMTPGPPIPAAAPVDRVVTCDAILYHSSEEPQLAKDLVSFQQFRLRD